MPIDFSKLAGNSTKTEILNPRDIFSILPKKSSNIQFPRDVQTEVMDKWFERRNETNLVLKMNTGSGKTIVGLLILKSCLNEGFGPAVYITPTPYLVQQVIKEAKKIGVNVTDNENDPHFLSGTSILVINIFKLFNGFSVFGTIKTGSKIAIGSLIIDDAHACMGNVEKQFTVDIPNTSKIYGSLLKIFEPDMRAQSESLFLEIESNDPYKSMTIPFWVWKNHISEITAVLHGNLTDESLKFKWDLISKFIEYCRCVVNGSQIEISPFNIPTEVIPSFYLAKRRIFMTATLSDDSVLVSHFGIDPTELNESISPKNANDIGDRIILIPQAYNPAITDISIKQYAKGLSKSINVVVLVPSIYRSFFWEKEAALILNAENLEDGVELLKTKVVGLVVIINKYDGIDLPDTACRMLIIDGLPDMRREIDKQNQSVLGQNDLVINQRIQQIEQGMGRGVRSNNDYCAIILMGSSLTNYLFNYKAKDKFTNTTKAQIELSESLAQQLHGSSLREIHETLILFFKRTPEWIDISKRKLLNINYETKLSFNSVIVALRKAYNSALAKDFQSSVTFIQEIINSTTDKLLKGWLKQILAEYTNYYDELEAQNILRSAKIDNPYLLNPIEGITYYKLKPDTLIQSQNSFEFISSIVEKKQNIILYFQGLLDDLKFTKDTSNSFEQAIADLGKLLGFVSQRPEKEFNQGPDVLWALGDLEFLIIECKNGAETDTISKKDINQLSGSINWFKRTYDGSCKSIPISIHKSNFIEKASSPSPGTKVLTEVLLQKLLSQLGKLLIALTQPGKSISADSVKEQLAFHKLDKKELLRNFLTDCKYS